MNRRVFLKSALKSSVALPIIVIFGQGEAMGRGNRYPGDKKSAEKLIREGEADRGPSRSWPEYKGNLDTLIDGVHWDSISKNEVDRLMKEKWFNPNA